MKDRLGLACAAIAAVACTLLLPGMAAAAKVGVVDINKVSEDSTYFKGELAALDALRQEKGAALDQQLGSLHYDLLLTDGELETYRQLTSKSENTPEEQQRLQALEGLNTSRRQELQDLMRVQSDPSSQLTQEQQARLSELNPVYQAALQRRAEAQKIYNDAQTEIANKEEEVRNRLWDEMSKAIESLAQEQKLEVVLQKSVLIPSAQGNQEVAVALCLYVEPRSDLTEAVIKAVDAAHSTATPAEGDSGTH